MREKDTVSTFISQKNGVEERCLMYLPFAKSFNNENWVFFNRISSFSNNLECPVFYYVLNI